MIGQDKLKAFLDISSDFRLGCLMTEGFCEKTKNLSDLVKEDVISSLSLLQEVDRDALNSLPRYALKIWELSQAIQNTLLGGKKVFLVGCGATGRLSLVLETLFRQKFGDSSQVVSFMAGGDYALIKSVESFEDEAFFGKRQLADVGFGEEDLLVASTEGGETPFVIGAVIEASRISRQNPFILYCNPDDLLFPFERARSYLENPSIKKISLPVGPMAISGSTRMQASTTLMLSIGIGLLYDFSTFEEFEKSFLQLIKSLQKTDYSFLAPFTSTEASLYQNHCYVNYITDEYLGVSILTDTTERSPTFSLRGFENNLNQLDQPSLSYLFLPQAHSSASAWEKLLWRKPRVVDWSELKGRVNVEKLLGFDLSSKGLNLRKRRADTEDFKIQSSSDEVIFDFGGKYLNLSMGKDILIQHLMIKMLLNAHSTIVMGILGRYEGNIMTWVRPSNNKLIDRSGRYILELLRRKNLKPSYEEVIKEIFKEMEHLEDDESIVMKVLRNF